jgi:hypothetical protein
VNEQRAIAHSHPVKRALDALYAVEQEQLVQGILITTYKATP